MPGRGASVQWTGGGVAETRAVSAPGTVARTPGSPGRVVRRATVARGGLLGRGGGSGPGVVRGGGGARPRGDRGQIPGVAVPTGPTFGGVAEDQAAGIPVRLPIPALARERGPVKHKECSRRRRAQERHFADRAEGICRCIVPAAQSPGHVHGKRTLLGGYQSQVSIEMIVALDRWQPADAGRAPRPGAGLPVIHRDALMHNDRGPVPGEKQPGAATAAVLGGWLVLGQDLSQSGGPRHKTATASWCA